MAEDERAAHVFYEGSMPIGHAEGCIQARGMQNERQFDFELLQRLRITLRQAVVGVVTAAQLVQGYYL